jgi:hypothetical protein
MKAIYRLFEDGMDGLLVIRHSGILFSIGLGVMLAEPSL